MSRMLSLIICVLAFTVSAEEKTINVYYGGGIPNAHVFAWVDYYAETPDQAYVDLGELPLGASTWSMPILANFQDYRMGQLWFWEPGSEYLYWDYLEGGPAFGVWWDDMPTIACTNDNRWICDWITNFYDGPHVSITSCEDIAGIIADFPTFLLGDPFSYFPPPLAPVLNGRRLAKGHNK